MIAEPKRHILRWPEHGVEMAFRLIPADSFRMGSRGNDPAEEPNHVVRIPNDFWMAETPVTQAQFALWTQAEGVRHENYFNDRPEHPAEYMDWREAVTYCAWLTKVNAGKLPHGFSLACLPTEAEWEYACRAGTDTEYYTGDGEAALAEAGWFEEEEGSGGTHPVRGKKPNLFQLYDMHGNVWEWCHDVWDEGAYRGGSEGSTDPWCEQRLSDWIGGLETMVTSDQHRVMRGGSWGYTAGYCRSASRFGNWPGDRGSYRGFRVCLVRGSAAERGAPQSDREAEPAPGDAGGASAGAPDLTQAHFPREAGRKVSEDL